MRGRRPPEDVSPWLALLQQRAPRPLAIPEMARMLAAARYDRKAIRAALDAAVADRRLRRIGKTRYQWVRDEAHRPGRGRGPAATRGRRAAPAHVDGHYARVRAGYGFVEPLGRAADHFGRDILIPDGMEGEALHGDAVRVEIVRRDPHRRRVVGRIVAVTGSAHASIIGTLERGRYGWMLIPFSDRLPVVEITGGPAPGRDDAGLVALARLTRPPSAGRAPGGELERVLGPPDDPEVQFLSIACEHGLRTEFPPAVAAEAEALPEDPDAADLAGLSETGRRDLRALPFVTIDGETARDFDDAVCLERRRGGGWRLWVAIADVAHYVRPGSALDREAAARGTSVYFPDRAIPMLPPRLSAQLCSLNPGRDRLAVAAELRYDRDGRLLDADCYRAVIRSRARLTYTKVAAVLSQADTAEICAWRGEIGDLLPQLRDMHALMGRLYAARLRAGSLDLDLPEALVDLSEAGRSVGVRVAPRNDAHRIIEEFMLEANRAVAARLRDRGLPLPYRIHEPPDPDDIDELNEQLAPFGFAVRYDGRVAPRDVQQLLDRLEGHRLARVLSRQVLRAMRQAQYSTVNAGHFGLAFPIYCHFTSPIRRYPDLLVHRQLGRLFDGQVERAVGAAAALETASVHSSQAERQAMEAERAMLDLKKAEFMLGHLLEPEPATVVSVTAAGLFVELDAYPVEGLVRAGDLPDDRYEYIEAERALKGLRTRQRFRLGDRAVVEATNVSLRRRQIDFALVRRLAPAIEDAPGAGPRRAGTTARHASRPRDRKPTRTTGSVRSKRGR